MRATHLLLATSADLPELAPDDFWLRQALAQKSSQNSEATSEIVIWDDPSVDWAVKARDCSAVLIRSCWDYSQKLPAFLGWLDHLQALGIRVINPGDTIRWNSDKSYLGELAARGVRIPRTLYLRRSAADWSNQLQKWLNLGQKIVIKPTISAGGKDTYLVDGPVVEEHLSRLSRERDWIVQDFLPAVVEEGEVSLVFLGGEFSHALRKRPRSGEFRVQSDHGGTVEPVKVVAPTVIEWAHSVLVAARLPLVAYARIDFVWADGSPHLMELELIEPELFFGQRTGAATEWVSWLHRSLLR